MQLVEVFLHLLLDDLPVRLLDLCEVLVGCIQLGGPVEDEGFGLGDSSLDLLNNARNRPNLNGLQVPLVDALGAQQLVVVRVQ